MIWVILAVVAITLLITLWLVIQLNRVRATITATPTDGNVFATLRKIDNELGHLDELVGAMGPRLASVEAKIPLAISYTGIVAFDAFDNIAGNLSRSIALLNEQGDGVVISLLVGRNETLFFTKQVRGRVGMEQLSPEESEAVTVAMRRTR
ncbi:MAG: DUF4446 family protein [Acidimicrobiia bacterium]|nr:DUF4446 family protein [Acidimicrobiia bacterium]